MAADRTREVPIHTRTSSILFGKGLLQMKPASGVELEKKQTSSDASRWAQLYASRHVLKDVHDSVAKPSTSRTRPNIFLLVSSVFFRSLVVTFVLISNK